LVPNFDVGFLLVFRAGGDGDEEIDDADTDVERNFGFS